MKKFFIILISLVAFTSCSEFQKALKSEDTTEKYKLAEQYFNDEKWNKANRLFAQLVPVYRGKPQAERLMYMYAKSYYNMKDYHLSGYQFERFEDAYPTSDKAEESAFLGAKSFYMLSPIFSKEQQDTKEALEKLQLFVNKYPESEYLEEANKLVAELDYKLEKKAFEIAKLYNKTAYYDSEDYEAAIKSFDNFLFEYPASSFREAAMYYRLDSAHNLAINSIESRKVQRLKDAKGYYDTLIKYYPASEYLEQANEMNQDIDTELAKYNTKS
ncbi:Beta-barrel assembly machine subunit BamD [Flavobacteriaceae bacterium MAR_2010_188]|nr:Beta-barrel assembly machine subunit BamD [Flavobacteriaceae bacterium MAR_2010_188]